MHRAAFDHAVAVEAWAMSHASAPLSVGKALSRVLECAVTLGGEHVTVDDAAGRVAIAPSVASIALPPFDRAAMDGYGVRARDVVAGKKLRLVGDVSAGSITSRPLARGEAIRISTGAQIPRGCDAILRSEDAAVEGLFVTARRVVTVGADIRHRAEDVCAGSTLVGPGDVLTLPRLSVLASAGVQRLVVSRRPELHLLVTGSELVPRGTPPEPGRIHDSNSLMVRLLAVDAGARVVEHGLVADDPTATAKAIGEGLAGDVLVVCGGVSVGAHDHVRAAFRQAGVNQNFWRVAMKPGKPMWFGTRGRTLVFGLPGNPLSAIVCTAVFVVPALRRLQGTRTTGPTLETAKLADVVERSPLLTTFVMSRLEDCRDGTLKAYPMSRQGSHLTGSFGQSDGFVVTAPGDAPLPVGSPIGTLRLTDRSSSWAGTECEAAIQGKSR